MVELMVVVEEADLEMIEALGLVEMVELMVAGEEADHSLVDLLLTFEALEVEVVHMVDQEEWPDSILVKFMQ